ncbi:MAG: hypothetical protein HY549_11390 [Elusimicrobia bacterium]|nr:hypothetical protein [Elusimicrobiota bacterium]
MNKKGSVIAYVLVMALVVATIAAGMARMLLMTYNITDRANKGMKGRKAAEGALALMLRDWNEAGGQSCRDFTDGSISYNCVGSGCDCTCNPTPAGHPTIIVRPDGGGTCNPASIEIIAPSQD